MGVAHCVGSDMCYWLMPVSGIPIINTTVQHITGKDLRNPDIKNRVDEFNTPLSHRLDDSNFTLDGNDINYFYPNDLYKVPQNGDPVQGDTDMEEWPEADDVDSYDKLIGAMFLLNQTRYPDHVTTKATVVCHKTDNLGNPMGKAHANPLLDTREYIVELEDGTYDSYFANVIAENLWSQCDAEGREFNSVRNIIGHRADNTAISKPNGFYYVNGQPRARKTTKGWMVNVEFTDGSTTWLPLKDVKESNPIELAEYAILSGIEEEPAFKWWVPMVIRKRNRMVNKVKKKYWRTMHKFGIRLPKKCC
jgi:hypothetical protein